MFTTIGIITIILVLVVLEIRHIYHIVTDCLKVYEDFSLVMSCLHLFFGIITFIAGIVNNSPIILIGIVLLIYGWIVIKEI